MNKGNFSAGVLVGIAAGLMIGVSAGHIRSENVRSLTAREIRQEAVEQGVASWVATQDGKLLFEWNTQESEGRDG